LRVRLMAIVMLSAACTQKPDAIVVAEEESVQQDLSGVGKLLLSDYGFFKGPLSRLEPAEHVFAYTLNSPLFSDYAFKKRFIYIPEGAHASYHASEVLDFPEGTVLIKNFYYPADFNKPEHDHRLLETRLLLVQKGEWKALTYVWNDTQTQAHLEVAGRTMPVQWRHSDGTLRKVNYSVPSINQCKGCHLKGNKVMPIGPTARQLNAKLPGADVSQLVQWQHDGILKNLPELRLVPRLAVYEDSTEPLAARARAWLEVNCAHCHRPDGPAKTSGLHLLADVAEGNVLGIGKAPVAAGKGSGGRLYGIVPGKPDQSILQYRIESTHPGIMMPELGRTLVHEEGVALVREWIKSMK